MSGLGTGVSSMSTSTRMFMLAASAIFDYLPLSKQGPVWPTLQCTGVHSQTLLYMV